MTTFPKVPNSLILSSYSKTAPKPMITVAPTIHNLWSDKILPYQQTGHNRRQQLSSENQMNPFLMGSFSETEPCPGRLSRLDLTRQSLSQSERQTMLRIVRTKSDRKSSSERMCRDNILQLLSDKLQARDSQQGR